MMTTNKDYKVLRSLYAEGADEHDPWGSAMGFTFALCAFITIEDGSVPEALGYRPAAVRDVADLYEEDDYTAQALRELNPSLVAAEAFAATMSRYLDLLKSTGVDY